jgi:hypothetical protein
MIFQRVFVLFFILCLGAGLQAQVNHYDNSLNYSGSRITHDSIEPLSIIIDGMMPEEVNEPFKVYSIVGYSLDDDKSTVDVERLKFMVLDSIRTVSPYSLVFWWPKNMESPLSTCEAYFSYPQDDIYQNCFSSTKVSWIEAKVRQVLQEQISGNSLSNYAQIEYEALKELKSHISDVYNCCASENKSECSLCISSDEIAFLKNSLKIRPIPTKIPLSSEVDYSVVSVPELDASNVQFYDYIGEDLVFGNVVISLDAAFQDFINVHGNNCDYSLYFLNEEAFCFVNFDTGLPNQFFVNISSTEGGHKIEIGGPSGANCPSFIDYLIEEYPDVFGHKVKSTRHDSDIEVILPVRTGGQTPSKNDDSPFCLYTLSGALLYLQDPSTTNSYSLGELRLSSPINPLAPLNTLTSFSYNDNEFVSYKWDGHNQTFGYYDRSQLQELKDSGYVVTTAYVDLASSFIFENPWAVVPEGETCTVIAYKYSDCNVGRTQCYWEVTATNSSISGPFQEVVIPEDESVICGDPSTTPEEVCCALGLNYIRDHLTGDLPQSERTALTKIGQILCDMGEWHFGEYGQDPWGDVPDALKIYYEIKLQNVGPNEDFLTYESLIPEFEAYKTRMFTSTRMPIETDTWRKMSQLLKKFGDGDFALIRARQKYHAIKVLATHLNQGALDEEYLGEDEDNENTIISLLKYSNPQDSCELLRLVTSDIPLLKQLFSGFNDFSLFEGHRDEYFYLIRTLLIKINSCPSVFNPQEHTFTKAWHIGFSRVRPGLICEIEIAGDCLETITLTNPSIYVQQTSVAVPPTYSCFYNYDYSRTFEINGPLQYIPVNVESQLYAGILESGTYLVPAFLFCYLEDSQINSSNREALIWLINIAVIPLTLGAMPMALGLRFFLAGIDIVGTVVTTSVNQEIENGSLRSSYSSDEDYEEFVNNYKKMEGLFNAAMLAEGVSEIATLALRKLARSIKKIRVGSIPTESPTYLRSLELINGFKKLRFIDYPNVNKLVERLGGSPQLYDRMAELSEDALAKLNVDLNGIQNTLVPDHVSALENVLSSNPRGFIAYEHLSKVELEDLWRMDLSLIERLDDDLFNSPGLKAFLEAQGESGVKAWKYSDDASRTTIWCRFN